MPTVTGRLEVEFIPGSGTWVDISTQVKRATIVRPRIKPGIAASPTVLTATIKNVPDTSGYSPFSPDSPAAAYFPNLTRDRRIRFTAIVAGVTTYVRFLGHSDKWLPEAAGSLADSMVTLTASCVLSRYARRKLLSYFGESIISAAENDYYPFNDAPNSTLLRGYSYDVVQPANGVMVPPTRSPGGAQLSASDGGHLSDGQIEFTRGNDNQPAPVVLIPLRAGKLVKAVCASYRLSTDPAGRTDDVIAAYDASGLRLWRWTAGISGGNIVWSLFDDNNVAKSFYDTGSPRDDSWHYWRIQFNSATGTGLFLNDRGGVGLQFGSFAWTYDPRPIGWLVVGGQMVPQRLGKQTNTFQGVISSLVVQYTTGAAADFGEFTVPQIPSDAGRTLLFLRTESDTIDNLVGGGVGTVGTGTDPDKKTGYTNATDNLLDRWNEHMLSVGGMMFTRPDGRRQHRLSSEVRPTTVALTLDANADLHMPAGGWSRIREEKPTRIVANSPFGSTTVIDYLAEGQTGLRLDGSDITTSAGSLSQAENVAWQLMSSDAARLSSFGVSATLTATDKTVALFGLLPGDRMRISNVLQELDGVQHVDCYASGWSEDYITDGQLCEFVFDTDPADDPSEGVFDSATEGRFAMDAASTVTGGTCVGTTGTGTVIITTTSPLTTTGGEYPLDLDWNGERITISGVGGGTSPQTATVTARGVAPAVARVHASGEIIDVYHSARFGV